MLSGSDVSPEKTLLQAAFSHLDLALANICEQAKHHEVSDADRSALSTAAMKLEYLASSGTGQQKALTPSVGVSHPCDPPLQLPSVVKKENKSLAENNVIVGGHGSDQQAKGNQRILMQENLTEQASALEIVNGGNQGKEIHPSKSRNTGNSVIMPTKSLQSPSGIARSTSPAPSEVIRDESEKQDLIDAVLKIVMDGFESLDEEKKFAIHYSKLEEMSGQVGCHKFHTHSVFKDMKRTSDGLIYQEEWSHIAREILAKHTSLELENMIQRTHDQRLGRSPQHLPSFRELRLKALGSRGRFIMSCHSSKRLVWDIIMTLLLVYVAMSLPLGFAFPNVREMEAVDNVLDWIFTCDLILNFCTTYVNQSREEIWEPRAIARNYLRTWFVLDFFSSVPLEQLTSGVFPRLAPAKLLKFGKIAKVFKIMRMSKMIRIWAGSELMEVAEELVWSYNLMYAFKGFKLVILLLVTGHWLACALLACGGDAIDDYVGNVETDALHEYLVAMYWAMMTMTTVGYGDVAMVNDWEKVYAICAMIIGGAFYGYIVGMVTTILSDCDLNQRAFTERMEMVVVWLNNHDELSPILRRRIWRHFKQFLTDKHAVEDSLILNDLPPQLRSSVSVALLNDSVRTSPIFQGLSIKGLCALVSILTENKFQADEVIVSEGERGKAMFIVDQGFVHWEQDGVTRQICPGDSFGGELLLLEVTEYKYTVKAHSKATLFRIAYDDFAVQFQELPQDLTIMCNNFSGVSELDASDMFQSPVTERGAASLLARGGSGAIPPTFPDTVLEYFQHLTSDVQYSHLQLEKMQDMFLHAAEENAAKTALSLKNPSRHIVQI